MRASLDETALRAIIIYKWVKGAVQLLLAGALLASLALGFGDELADWAHTLRPVMVRRSPPPCHSSQLRAT